MLLQLLMTNDLLNNKICLNIKLNSMIIRQCGVEKWKMAWYKNCVRKKRENALEFPGGKYSIETINPLTPVAISKQLEMIGRSDYILACSIATALHSDINQTAGSGGHLSMWENRCTHATVCLLRTGQPRRAGDVVKSGQFTGQFTWVTGDSMVVKGLITEFEVDPTIIFIIITMDKKNEEWRFKWPSNVFSNASIIISCSQLSAKSSVEWPLRYHELRRLQRSTLLVSQHQPFGMTFLSNWHSLPISMDLKLNLKLIFLLRVNHSHLTFWIFLDF